MKVQQQLEAKIRGALQPTHLEVINESHRHNVPPGSEKHFKVIAVSPAFEGKAAVARHREVYGTVAEELKNGVHALSLHLFTPSEWEKQKAPSSPPCLGGSKADKS